jgi:hypothetical protein
MIDLKCLDEMLARKTMGNYGSIVHTVQDYVLCNPFSIKADRSHVSTLARIAMSFKSPQKFKFPCPANFGAVVSP